MLRRGSCPHAPDEGIIRGVTGIGQMIVAAVKVGAAQRVPQLFPALEEGPEELVQLVPACRQFLGFWTLRLQVKTAIPVALLVDNRSWV